MAYRVCSLPVIALVALFLSSCSKDNASSIVSEEPTINAATPSIANQVHTASVGGSAGNSGARPADNDEDTSLSPDDVPYPLYPNGLSYRIGDEGKLKIILFQTEDSFEQVDSFYREKSQLERLSSMSGYVRYSVNEGDIDPWETAKPGIVIHQFNDASEREAVGAGDDANTNIIMSFE